MLNNDLSWMLDAISVEASVEEVEVKGALLHLSESIAFGMKDGSRREISIVDDDGGQSLCVSDAMEQVEPKSTVLAGPFFSMYSTTVQDRYSDRPSIAGFILNNKDTSLVVRSGVVSNVLEPDPKVVEQYQHVVIQPSLRQDGVNGGMDWYCPAGA